jgi:hypothetical protein
MIFDRKTTVLEEALFTRAALAQKQRGGAT